MLVVTVNKTLLLFTKELRPGKAGQGTEWGRGALSKESRDLGSLSQLSLHLTMWWTNPSTPRSLVYVFRSSFHT